jgi:hypothetical protein
MFHERKQLSIQTFHDIHAHKKLLEFLIIRNIFLVEGAESIVLFLPSPREHSGTGSSSAFVETCCI